MTDWTPLGTGRGMTDKPLVNRDEYQRIRYATASVLMALTNCPYCGFEECHHDTSCVLHELAEAVERPHLDRLNRTGRWSHRLNRAPDSQSEELHNELARYNIYSAEDLRLALARPDPLLDYIDHIQAAHDAGRR